MKPKSIKFAAMTIHEANLRLLFQLYEIYDDREAANIADLVMEHITGWKRIDRVTNKQVKMSESMMQQLEKYSAELLMHKPVQYVLNEAWFMGMNFYVDEHVLIPRPETEELVDFVIKKAGKARKKILDIGTGSGCIAVSLKKYLPDCDVHAMDISAQALAVAEKNAGKNQVEIKFVLTDILDEKQWHQYSTFDYIVSNPPYIPSDEIILMHENVTRFEPHLALFVPDNDPLKFYKAIAKFAEKKLLPGGMLFVEVHENYAEAVQEVFSRLGDAEIMNDMQGKQRFISLQPYQP